MHFNLKCKVPRRGARIYDLSWILFNTLIFLLCCPGVLVYYSRMNRKVIQVIVMVAALIIWFILNPKPGPAKYAGAIVVIGAISVIGMLMKPKQPNVATDDSAR